MSSPSRKERELEEELAQVKGELEEANRELEEYERFMAEEAELDRERELLDTELEKVNDEFRKEHQTLEERLRLYESYRFMEGLNIRKEFHIVLMIAAFGFVFGGLIFAGGSLGLWAVLWILEFIPIINAIVPPPEIVDQAHDGWRVVLLITCFITVAGLGFSWGRSGYDG